MTAVRPDVERHPAPVWARLDVVGGRGGTAAELADLDTAAAALERAADLLVRAHGELVRASWALPAGGAAGPAVLGTLSGPDPVAESFAGVLHGPSAPALAAEDLRALAGRLRTATQGYEAADGDVRRDVATAVGEQLGERPLLTAVLGGLVAVQAVGVLVRAAPVLAVVAAVPAAREGLVRVAGRQVGTVPGRLVEDGQVAGMLRAASAFLVAVRPGDQHLSHTAVRPAARAAAQAMGGDGARVAVTALGARLGTPPVASASDAMALVASSTPAGGSRAATVTIQRIDRPDGARSWVIAVPGTQSAGVAGRNPFDMRTNLELVGGVPDGVSAAVERAMVLAGIGAEEPVLLAGHSQGGMVAAGLAAGLAGRYDVRAVLTAGSPDASPPVPPGAQVLHLERASDAVPVLDGDRSARDRPAATTVTDPRAVGPLVRAHEVGGYVAMARDVERTLADDPSVAAWQGAADEVLGPPGSRAVTTQYELTRLRPGASPAPPPTARS